MRKSNAIKTEMYLRYLAVSRFVDLTVSRHFAKLLIYFVSGLLIRQLRIHIGHFCIGDIHNTLNDRITTENINSNLITSSRHFTLLST